MGPCYRGEGVYRMGGHHTPPSAPIWQAQGCDPGGTAALQGNRRNLGGSQGVLAGTLPPSTHILRVRGGAAQGRDLEQRGPGLGAPPKTPQPLFWGGPATSWPARGLPSRGGGHGCDTSGCSGTRSPSGMGTGPGATHPPRGVTVSPAPWAAPGHSPAIPGQDPPWGQPHSPQSCPLKRIPTPVLVPRSLLCSGHGFISAPVSIHPPRSRLTCQKS